MSEKKRGNLDKLKRLELGSLFSYVKSGFNPRTISLKITGIYLFVGGIWIIFSDRLAAALIDDKQTLLNISIMKGWAYVIITGIIIYSLITKALIDVKNIQKKLTQSSDELAATLEELEASYEDLSSMEGELKTQYQELLLNQERLKKSEERYRLVSEASNDGIWDYDFITKETYFSERYCSLLGYKQEEFKEMSAWFNLIHPDDLQKAIDNFQKYLQGEIDNYSSNYRVKAKDGQYKWIYARAKALFDEQGKPYRAAGSHTDISQIVEYQNRLQSLAYNDQMTNLPNRVFLYEKIGTELDEFSKNNVCCAVLYIDTDNFKLINDYLGHSFGDKLITEVGRRLKRFITDKTHLFRLGGDEMIFYLIDVKGKEEVEVFARQVINSYREPYNIGGNIFHITASIGISMFPQDGVSIEQLLKNADMAMYKVKEHGKNGYCFFDSSINDELGRKIKMEADLRKALVDNEFLLYYQPLVNASSQKIEGFEALIRWNSLQMGLVSPMEFISVAEETGFIVPIGEWVLRTACDYIRQLNEKYGQRFKVSVNISVIQLMQNNFSEMVLGVLEDTGLEPKFLELEITESNVLDSPSMIEKLKVLRKKGVSVALDDFGKGYSSLSCLRQLPITKLKIDKSFIDDISQIGSKKSITDSIIAIGHKAGLCVVAEGVETKEQLDYLVQNKCDIIQGYYFGKPLPPEECEKEYVKKNM